jgi:hypothetical protein
MSTRLTHITLIIKLYFYLNNLKYIIIFMGIDNQIDFFMNLVVKCV